MEKINIKIMLISELCRERAVIGVIDVAWSWCGVWPLFAFLTATVLVLLLKDIVSLFRAT